MASTANSCPHRSIADKLHEADLCSVCTKTLPTYMHRARKGEVGRYKMPGERNIARFDSNTSASGTSNHSLKSKKLDTH
eukprot:1125401-Amphidinium_carterae.1